MKKFLFFAAALIAMGCGMSSCSNEVDVTEKTEQAPKLTKLVFTVAQDAETRVAWGGEHDRTPMFEEGDKVSLFSANNINTMLTAHVDGEGNVTLTGEGTSGDTNLYFVYPYDADARYYSYNPDIIYGNSSTDSTSPYNYDVSNMLNPGIDKYPWNALSLAKSTDGGTSAITFQGLTTIIKFTPAADCTGYININAGDDVFPVTGVNIDLNESKITTEDMTMAISLPKEDYMYNFEAGKSYYFALPPFTMLSGGYIDFVDDEYQEHTIYTASADKNFVAGKIYNLKYGSTGGEVDFTKSNTNISWTGSGTNTLTGTDSQSGVTLTLTRSQGNITRSTVSGTINFSSAQVDQTITISVTGKKATSLTSSATSKTLEGEGPWVLTYKTTPEVTTNGWYTNGGAGVAFILASSIAGSDKLTVVYE